MTSKGHAAVLIDEERYSSRLPRRGEVVAYKCPHCHRVLFEGIIPPGGVVQFKCKGCKHPATDFGPGTWQLGMSLQQHRCPTATCNARLFDYVSVEGLDVTVRCRRCRHSQRLVIDQ